MEQSLKRMWWLECNKDDTEQVKRAADRVRLCTFLMLRMQQKMSLRQAGVLRAG